MYSYKLYYCHNSNNVNHRGWKVSPLAAMAALRLALDVVMESESDDGNDRRSLACSEWDRPWVLSCRRKGLEGFLHPPLYGECSILTKCICLKFSIYLSIFSKLFSPNLEMLRKEESDRGRAICITVGRKRANKRSHRKFLYRQKSISLSFWMYLSRFQNLFFFLILRCWGIR